MSDTQFYLIALGSNQRVPRIGNPRAVLRWAVDMFEATGLYIEAVSTTINSRPIGPSQRHYANAAAVVKTGFMPEEVLAILQHIEMLAGRTRRGQRWRSRGLDLDIVLWSGGIVAQPDLVIPHRLFRERDFVLGPASQIAPDWRDPVTGLTLRQLRARAPCVLGPASRIVPDWRDPVTGLTLRELRARSR